MYDISDAVFYSNTNIVCADPRRRAILNDSSDMFIDYFSLSGCTMSWMDGLGWKEGLSGVQMQKVPILISIIFLISMACWAKNRLGGLPILQRWKKHEE